MSSHSRLPSQTCKAISLLLSYNRVITCGMSCRTIYGYALLCTALHPLPKGLSSCTSTKLQVRYLHEVQLAQRCGQSPNTYSAWCQRYTYRSTRYWLVPDYSNMLGPAITHLLTSSELTRRCDAYDCYPNPWNRVTHWFLCLSRNNITPDEFVGLQVQQFPYDADLIAIFIIS